MTNQLLLLLDRALAELSAPDLEFRSGFVDCRGTWQQLDAEGDADAAA
jgi:hypothetical protein